MLIGHLAQRSGVSKDAIRLYTKLGLLQPKPRQAGTRTYAEYSEEDVELVGNILLSKSAGFTLSEIQVLAADYFAGTMTPARHKAILTAKLQEVRDKQHSLELLAVRISEKIKLLDC